jgi:hypothetical protein
MKFLCLSHLPVPLLHGPDADHHPPPYPDDPGEFPESSDASFRRGDVVDDGDRQNGVQTVVAKRQRQVITEHHLKMTLWQFVLMTFVLMTFVLMTFVLMTFVLRLYF